MSGDIRSAFITLALSLPAIVLCLSIHETAHGGAAYLLGDRTARDSGRVTLSPMAHIDPIGFLCLLLFGFGWAGVDYDADVNPEVEFDVITL